MIFFNLDWNLTGQIAPSVHLKFFFFTAIQSHNYLKVPAANHPSRVLSRYFDKKDDFAFKSFVVCTINLFYSTSTENIAVRLRLMLAFLAQLKAV